MASYRLNDDARADLSRIYQYGLHRYGEEQADAYLTALFDRFEEIAGSPQQYPAVNDVRERYRRSVCGSDSIYYRLGADGIVEIMAVIGLQNTNVWL